MSTPLPKLSYVLLSHNREKYIRGAIESAFAQDYEGELEYIFSDDCSTDRTFEIIKECVAEYKGNRRVVVTQTPRNLRLAGNTNHAVQFVESEWIIRADDDDISSRSRCQLIGSAIARHPDVKFIATSYLNFTTTTEKYAYDLSSKRICETYYELICNIRDTSLTDPAFDYDFYFKAWNIDIYRKFPPLPTHADYVDDYICFFRGCVLGPALYLTSSPLVFARTDCNNQSLGDCDETSSEYRKIVKYERFLDKYFNISIAPMKTLYQEVQNFISAHYSQTEIASSLAFSESFKRTIQKMEDNCSYWRKGIRNRWQILRKYERLNVFTLIRCFPLPVFATLLSAIRFVKRNIFRKV